MNTPWSSSRLPRPRAAGGASRGVVGSSPAVRPGVFAVLLAAAALTSLSCTFSGGELLYVLGAGRGAPVEARFRLTDGPLMIFVDDVGERVDRPRARSHLCDDLSQELLRHEAAKRIVPRATIESLRKSMPDFDKRGCRELGEMVGAEQVLWIEVHDFLAEEQIVDAGTAAYWMVTVKVIDVRQKESRTRVRLWPKSPEGFVVTAKLNGADVDRLKTKDAIAKELSDLLVVDIAKLFYDHRLGDFERSR